MKPHCRTMAGWIAALLLLFHAAPALAQGEVLIKEIVSREFSLHVGGVESSPVKEAVSREFSISVENGKDGYAQTISREYDLLINSTAPPPVITELEATVSPTGETAVLDWGNYNQWAIGDILRFDIYFSDDGPITSITGLTPYRTIGGGATSITLTGLAPNRDHFFAVVPVDGLGNFIPTVNYAAAYVLSPQSVSREYSLFIGEEPASPYRVVVSREYDLAIVSPAPPPAITGVIVNASPSGDAATLDWSSYNQWAVGDIQRFDVYLSDSGAFTSVSGLTPYRSIGGGATSISLTGLSSGADHFFAVVPVDALGNFLPVVNYAAAYVLSPQSISREYSLFVGQENAPSLKEVVSRELSIVVPDAAVPAPVTGVGSGFAGVTSTTAFGAVDLDWSNYNELVQNDVIRYRVYVGNSFFETVTGLTPYKFVQSGRQRDTVTGLNGNGIYHFAVVAEDALGNFNPAVRSFSAQASISGVGEVINLTGTSFATSLRFTWGAPPGVGTFLQGYRVYFGGSTVPVELPVTATFWEATGLTPGTGHPFRITTLDPFGGESSGASLVGATLLANPLGVRLAARGDEVELLWDAVQPSALVSHYTVYRSTTPFTNISAATRISADPAVGLRLGSFASVAGQHYAVAAVNTLGGVRPEVVSVQATKQTQTINFSALAPDRLEMSLTAIASSGLPVVFEASPSQVATVQGNILRIHRGGTVVVTATQEGDANYWPASTSQTLRMPPVITQFTANGSELTNEAVLSTASVLLAAQALDASGIEKAEFFRRAGGAPTWISLGVDDTPGNGLTANLPLASLEDGAAELRVVVTTPDQVSAVREHSVVFSLAPVLTMTLDTTLIEGDSLTGSVSIARARPAELPVTLAASRANQVNPGPPVTIPAGQTSAAFTIQGRQDNAIESPLEVRITATAPGALAVEKVVTLVDEDTPFLTLTLDRASISEAAGPQALTATVTRSPVNPAALTVSLVSSNPSALVFPAAVTIPENEATASFPVGVLDNAVADGTRTVLLGVEFRLNGSIISDSPKVAVAIGDDEGPRLEFFSGRTWVLEGASNSITVRRSGAPMASALTVVLSGAPAGEISLPPSVVIPAGAQEANFQVFGIADGKADDGAAAQLTGTASGFSPAALALVVADQAKPDLVAKNAAGPPAVDTEANFSVSYRIENNGAAPTAAPFTQRILLSRDAVVGNDVLLSQYVFSGTLNAGVGFDRAETVRAPREAGTYYLLVTTDATHVVEEILETNNTSVAVQPLVVSSAYGAVVQTAVSQVPANTPIPLTGSATKSGGVKVPHVMVNIHIRVGGTERIIAALTNSAGDFSTTWQPLPGEGGDYEIGAAHPGVSTAPTQDAFALLTVGTEFPIGVLAFDEGGSLSLTGTLTNPTAYGITGLSLAGANLPAGLTLQPTLPGTTLASGQSVQAGVVLTAAAGFYGDHTITLRLTTGQGVSLDLPLRISVRRLVPQLVANPGTLKASALRGGQKTVDFTLENQGGAPSGPVEILLPNVAWMRLSSPSTLPSILPGQSASVSLLLEPPPTQALTAYNGTLAIVPATGQSSNLPFEFRVVSNLTGDLKIEAVDEYFYFTAAAPKLAGATVTLRDAVTAAEISGLSTAADGSATFSGIPEGWYAVEVTAEKHTHWKGNLYVNAGEVNFRQVFLSLELVSYSWTVEEIELQDRYKITVETTFETNVPAPVVTISPAVLDVEDVTVLGQTKVINFTIENHGFIAADHGNFTFDQHPFYEVTPLIENIGLIPAKSSITVPVTVRRIGEFAEDGSVRLLPRVRAARGNIVPKDRASVPCAFGGRIAWDFICGIIPVPKSSGIPASGVEGNCPGGSWNPQGGGGPGGGGVAGSSEVSFTSAEVGCLEICQAKAVVDCVIGFTPFGCPWAAANCAVYQDAWTCGTGALCWAGPYVNGVICAASFLKCYADNPPGTPPPQLPRNGGQLILNASSLGDPWLELMDEKVRRFDPRVAEATARLETLFDYQSVVLGSRSRVLATAGSSYDAWFRLLADAGTAASGMGLYISAGEKALLSASASSNSLDGPLLDLIVARFNRTLDYHQRGIHSIGEVPAGESLDFIQNDLSKVAALAFTQATLTSQQLGFDDPADEFKVQYYRAREALAGNQGGVCAKVKIKLDQEAVMTRSAFRGTLELVNNQANGSLEEVGFSLDIRDLAGGDARELFNIQVTRLTGLAAIDGSGQIGAQTTGSAQWTLIPRDTAALLEDTVYTVGGTIRYDQGGTLFSIPVTPVRITVRPDAALHLKYFHQRDVFSDDPHTDPIEPSIPYWLAVMVENRGAGSARNLSITSAQPEIVENEKGLLIDFNIIGTEVAGENLSPSLTANFGEVAPGQRKIGTWLMTSTLQGLFIDYKATFQHLDSFGDDRLSLLQDVSIHEMIHPIEALGTMADGLPDFLVNDIADIKDYPDTIHLSDGSTAPVSVLETANVSAPPTATNSTVGLSTDPGTGWTYLRIPEPSNGTFQLTGVRRSDGLAIPLDKNVWTTDRTFIGLGRRPIRENVLHLTDFNSTGSYTLTYGPAIPAAGSDTTPPVSQVTALPAQSGVTIPVRWSGTDAGGITSYDIFVQIDNGPWQPWLTATDRTSSVYAGEAGRRYAFYSRAYDAAGNPETQSANADTFTVVSMTNQPPVIAPVPAQSVAEGLTFEYQITASDPDGAVNGLHYEIASTLSGVVITPTGLVRWVTGEADGGRSGDVTVTVTDSGIPAASSQVTFRLSANETNAAPLIGAIGPQSIVAEQTLRFAVTAGDNDFPAQSLSWQLAGTPPPGMNINSATGAFSWTPTRAQAGESYPVEVLVTDSGAPPITSRMAFSITVLVPAPKGPAFDPVGPWLWLSGKVNSQTVRATDPDGDPVTVTADLSSLPPGPAFFGAAGTGLGTLSWDIPDPVKGVFQLGLSARSGAETAGTLLSLRVEPATAYWKWAARNLAGVAGDASAFGMLADPDADGMANLFEMTFLRDPLRPDAMELDFRPAGMFGAELRVFDLAFRRNASSASFVELRPQRATILGNWEPVPEGEWDFFVDPDGESETETVRWRFYVPSSAGRTFYRIEARLKSGVVPE